MIKAIVTGTAAIAAVIAIWVKEEHDIMSNASFGEADDYLG